jgi:hypothetical protein
LPLAKSESSWSSPLNPSLFFCTRMDSTLMIANAWDEMNKSEKQRTLKMLVM